MTASAILRHESSARSEPLQDDASGFGQNKLRSVNIAQTGYRNVTPEANSQDSVPYVQNNRRNSCPPTTMSAAMSHVALTPVRTVLVVITALVGGVIPVWAQQSEPSSASLD